MQLSRTPVWFLLAAFLATSLASVVRAQDSTRAIRVLPPASEGKVQRLTLKDGSQLVGKITAVDSTSIQFESALGVTTVPIDAIESVREETPGKVVEGRYYFPNPNATRLIFAPTGRMLPKGQGYFSDFWIFFPSIAAGLTDWVTFGGGTSILPGVSIDEQIYFLTPKIAIARGERFNAAIGALAIAVPTFEGGSKRQSAGLLYGVGTWGSMDQSFTAGLGYGYVGGTLAQQPIFMLGGETRAAPRISLVTENYIFPGSSGLVSAAIRFMGQDISVDLGLARPIAQGESFTFPLLNFMWKW